jgi:uncharacterized protein (DUF1330 family)
MPKAYLISAYRAIKDPVKLAAYAALAKPAIEAAGGTFIARGMPEAVYEGGVKERTVVIEFDSLEKALAAYHTPAYTKALEALDGGAERDMRVVPGA